MAQVTASPKFAPKIKFGVEKRNEMRFLILITLSLIIFDTFAQRKVSGYVFDEYNEPLIGASIIEIPTENQTITNLDGWFELLTTTDTCEIGVSGRQRGG